MENKTDKSWKEIMCSPSGSNELRFWLVVAPCALCSKSSGPWKWPKVTTSWCGPTLDAVEEIELICRHDSVLPQIPATVVKAASVLEAIARWNEQNWEVHVTWNHTFTPEGVEYALGHVCRASNEEVLAMLQIDLSAMSRVLEQREHEAMQRKVETVKGKETEPREVEVSASLRSRDKTGALSPQAVPFTPEAVREYLHQAVTKWRLIRAHALEEIPTEDRDDLAAMAPYYIDAFQSVHVSLFGTLIP